MSKTKKPSTTDKLALAATQAGVLLMAGAATMGMLDLPSHPERRIVLPNRPAFAFAENNLEEENTPIRREREETAPHYISYSVVQRTASRSGKH